MTRIGELKISQNELARRAHISKSALSEALAPDSVQTTVMREIHKALGWEPPPTGFSPDALEALSLYDQMPDREQGEILAEMRARVEKARDGRTRTRRRE